MSSPAITMQNALISVFDKTALDMLAIAFSTYNVQLISTGKTAKILQPHNPQTTDISDYTGCTEILGGRVKTLHPKVFAGILARYAHIQDQETMNKQDIPWLDCIVVNFYPFAAIVEKKNVTYQEVIENIDIGGPSLVRAAAKNWQRVCVLVDPEDYPAFITELHEKNGKISAQTRLNLARKAFAYVAAYDIAISQFFSTTPEKIALKNTAELNKHGSSDDMPDHMSILCYKATTLRYGENPHQKAACYHHTPHSLDANYQQLQGKELSYNNMLDAQLAYNVVSHNYENPCCAIIKHQTPCGVAIATTIEEALAKALTTDPISAFGGVVAFNCTVTEATTLQLKDKYLEVIIAPGFTDGACNVMKKKHNVRLIIACPLINANFPYQIHFALGHTIIQEKDPCINFVDQWRTVTTQKTSPEVQQNALFAWNVVKHIKSNAIVFCREQQTIGIAGGHVSRVDAVHFAISKAQKAGLSLEGTVIASDAFFPFADSIDLIAQSGAIAIIQPGGSIRDPEVIQAANKYNLAMIFTDKRHFCH